MRRFSRRNIRGDQGGSLESQILALLGKGASGGVQALYLAKDSATYRTLSGTAVTEWKDVSGLGRHATQATAGARPAWATNSMTLDGGDELHTAAIDLTSFERIALSVIAADSLATLYILADFAGVTAGRCALVVNDAAGTVAAYGRTAASNVEARSAATHGLAAAKCLRATVDYTLAVNATEIWSNTVNITNSRPTNPDASAATVANGALSIGNRAAADLGLQGSLYAVMLSAWPAGTAFPTTALAAAEQLLMREWSVS